MFVDCGWSGITLLPTPIHGGKPWTECLAACLQLSKFMEGSWLLGRCKGEQGQILGAIYRLFLTPAHTREGTSVLNCFAPETSVGGIVLLCIHLITSWGSVLPVFCMGLAGLSMCQTTHMLVEG